jgi:hypothetical protein
LSQIKKHPILGEKGGMTMKIRLLSVVLAVSLFLSGAALAEADAFASLQSTFEQVSTSDLLMLKTMLEVEIASREDKNMEVTVPAGIYYVGVDIPAGIYTIIDTSDSYLGARFCVYDPNGYININEHLSKGSRIGKVELNLGDKVKIENHPVIFTTYKGLGF